MTVDSPFPAEALQKGITGTEKFQRLARGKAIEPGSFEGCVRNKGTFELQK